MPVTDWLQRFSAYLTNERALSPRTVSAYERDLDRFSDYLNRQQIEDLNQVSEHHIRALIDLEFSNGERRRYQRLKSRGLGAVIVVPVRDDGQVLLIREYAAGLHRYELGLVKGRLEAGEDMLEAAQRELQEEAGFAARELTELTTLSLAPGYMTHVTHVVLARDRSKNWNSS